MLPEQDLKLLEFHKLQKILEQNNISFEVEELYTGARMKLPSIREYDEALTDKRICVTCCNGSYGHDDGLLELWLLPCCKVDLTDTPYSYANLRREDYVIGYLNANACFELICKALEK